MKRGPIGALVVAAALTGARSAPAQSVDVGREERVHGLSELLEAEPTLTDVREAAMRNFAVHPEAIEHLRGELRTKAGGPILVATGRYGGSRAARDTRAAPPGSTAAVIDTDDRFGSDYGSTTLGLSWSLAGAVFTPSQLQTYAMVDIQQSLLRELTRLYYLRRQLVTRLIVDPPVDPRAQFALRMRVEEFTSLLDVFTGHWYSRHLPAGSPRGPAGSEREGRP